MPDKQPARRFSSGRRPRLVLGGLAAVGVTLSGCESADQQAAQFTSVAACTQAGFEASLCQSAQAAAQQDHQQSAPRFNSLASCEEEWGTSSCEPAAPAAGSNAGAGSGSGSVFVPMAAGFILSQAMQRSFYQNGNIGYYGGGYGGGPVYRNRTGTPVTVSRNDGKMIKTPVNVNTASVSRRGFGGMGMSRGSSFGG